VSVTEARDLEGSKTVYRVEGFTCANCAGKFESHVKQLPGVRDAKVNFGAAKLTVIGEATVEELEQAGAFENLKVIPEKPARGRVTASGTDATQADGERPETGQDAVPGGAPFYKRHALLIASACLTALGYVSLFASGEHHPLTTLLFAAAILIGGFRLFKVGLDNLRRLEFDMRTLMTVAIIGAAIIGEWAEGAVVVILFALSEALERYTMDNARRSIRSLMNMTPKEALVRRDGREVMLRVEDIAVGDTIIVRPGQKIAMDGVVTGGVSAVNQSAITGESIPVEKAPGDEVFAGTLNGEGLLEVRVTRLVEDTTIAKIIHLVEEAQGERAPAQAFVDRFARYYTPLIMIVALAVAVLPPLFDGEWLTWIYQGLSVLVVGCPCALVISTPIAIVSAIGNAARHGVLIKGGIYLEQLCGLRAVAWDKTGTLTSGVPAVTDVAVIGDVDRDRLLSIVAALEHRSQHPLAAAVVRKAQEAGVAYDQVRVDAFTSITGKGIQGTVDGNRYFIGNERLVHELGIELSGEAKQLADRLRHEGKTVMLVCADSRICAVIAAADEVRESAGESIRRLRQLGVVKTVMLTGDNHATAQVIAGQCGIDELRAELMPQDKLNEIRRLRDAYGQVAMVGDGVNDAPALAAASVGIAMTGAGTDVALESADVALMGDDLGKLPFAIRLSRRALAVIRQNITFSLLIKLIALLLVVPGWLTLWIAIASDMGATLLVALNSMRLMNTRA
jgi:Cd2+/Zn2+-exporting ATPase